MSVAALPSGSVTSWEPLYKQSNTGAIQEWDIRVEGCTIITRHGQLGGAIQETKDTITKGKNVGKKNETTPETQAFAEAHAKWTKKKQREGYVEDIERARAGETDTAGGIAPMLAQPREDGEKHIKFPCHAQRKYNGVRCLVVIEDGAVSLWSRKRKRILGVPHIQAAYERAFLGGAGSDGIGGRCVLDGELYRHGWSLQKISGFVRKEKTKPGFEELTHNVYDFPSHLGTWVQREIALHWLPGRGDIIRSVETMEVHSMVEVKSLHDQWVMEGYEGAILRNLHGLYEPGRRSPNLVKIKEFHEAEFKIIGVKEGRGKFAGKAIFMCVTDTGEEFDCSAPGTLEDRAEFLRRAPELVGKMLTVKYFEMTDDLKPSHGVGVAVRDYE